MKFHSLHKTMASFFLRLLLLSSLLVFSPLVVSGRPHSRPRALLAPVIKDRETNLYTTTLSMRDPLVSLDLTLDLGTVRYLWVACKEPYTSPYYRPVACGTPECKLSGSTECRGCEEDPAQRREWCHNNTCGLTPENPVPFSPVDTFGEASEDRLVLRETDGSAPGKVVAVDRFLFACAPEFLVWQLPNTSVGFAALGRSPIGLPAQLSRALGVSPILALCLPAKSGPRSQGVMFFGGGPYIFRPKIDVSQSLAHTTLITNPMSMAFTPKPGEPSYEYFIQLNSIRVSGKLVPTNATLLNMDKKTGNYGTKLSTVKRLTRLETSIYDAVTEAFVKEAEAMGITRAKSDGSRRVCFNAKTIGTTATGPAVPLIEFVLESAQKGKMKEVVWKIPGANSIVFRNKKVACLAFEDSGDILPELNLGPESAVVIGAHMLEDNLLKFDLRKSTLGFSSSLLYQQTSCSNFNFATKA